MEVITIETKAFYRIIEEIVKRLEKVQKQPNRWISEKDAMSLLGIRSKTTLWKLRSEGKISYTAPSRKLLLYDRESIMAYLEEHRFETF
jgi:hypothetical protein